MLLKILVTANALVFVLIVPVLEVGPSHVFNPEWPAHAKLHEVWQLATNAALSLLALWLTWRRQNSGIAALISLAIGGGFVFAYLVQQAYGGSMAHPDGSELLLLGINPAIGVVGLISVGLVAGLLLQHRRAAPRAA